MKLIKWKLKHKAHYFICHLLDNEKEMYEYFEKTSGCKISKTGKFMVCEDINRVKKFGLFLGDIYFNKESFSIDTLCHETLHATIDFDRKVNKNKNASYGKGNNRVKEERICSLFEIFLRQSLKYYYKYKKEIK